MKDAFRSIKRSLELASATNRIYRELRKHLDRQPVGYPATLSGVELQLLKTFFTTTEAKAALVLSYRFDSLENLCARAKAAGYEQQGFSLLLESMEKKGSIISRNRDGETQYALHPFVLGIWETNVGRMTAGSYMGIRRYFIEGYSLEYLTAQVPQMRVIPINSSLMAVHNVAPYDQIREIVDKTGDRISLSACICKNGKDLIGHPCKVTKRREICLYFGDYADSYTRNGWGKPISKKEALDILDQNEKDGLVLMPSSMQEPHVVCSCCECCCGIMETIKTMPRPVDFAASNYFAEFNDESCNGCKICMKRCQMGAIRFDETSQKVSGINLDKCLGCGLCVPTCRTGSIRLRKKDKEFIPPQDFDDLYETIMKHKKGMGSKVAMMAKAMMGLKI